MEESQKKVVSPVSDMDTSEGIALGEQLDTESPLSSKRLLRKIDWSLLPLMGVTYMLQFLDKQALGQSSIMGIMQDLHLTGNQYSWAGSIFYFSYLLFSYPVSMLMVRLPIGKFLAVNAALWGTVLACHAASSNFAGIMVTRFFLGATEAAISPGFSLITGMWYTRDEQPLRHGLWFAGNSVATAFGGLMAFGVAHIQGSLTAWKWLFIIYGLITVAWAVILLMFLPDTPSSARFLKEYEKQAANERTQNNQTGTKNNIIQWDQVWEALLDYKVWILFFFQVANNVPNGGLTMFGSLVLAGFGFTTLQVYLLQMPMGVFHALFSVGSTFLASKFRNSRCILVACCTIVSLVGCVIIYRCENKGARLFGMFIFSAYAAGIPMTLSMVSSNVAGFTKKATISAMMFIAYCIGNIIGPFLFFSNEAPVYDSGFISIIICLVVATVLILTLGFCWRWENRRRDQLSGPPVPVAVTRHEEKQDNLPSVAVEDLTDVHNQNFRYIY